MKNFPLFTQKYHFHLRNFIKNAVLLFYFPQKNLPTPALFQTGNGQIVFLFRYNILQPDTFLDKNESDDALDQVNRHNHKVDCVDRKSGKTA